MSSDEVRPGLWYTTGRSSVMAAKDYHASYLSTRLEKRLPPLPPLPADLEQGLAQGRLTDKQVDRLRQWGKSVREGSSAWRAKIQTVTLPEPPRRGMVVVDWRRQDGRIRFYNVGQYAQEALLSLRRIAEQAEGLHEGRLRWIVHHYWNVERRDYRSARTVMVNQQLSVKSRYALAEFCLRMAQREPVRNAAVQFVKTFGPLILDFGAWCCDTEYGAFATRYPSMAADMTSPLRLLGDERFLWPPKWWKWATRLYGTTGRFREPPVRVPPPIGFYVWASYMMTALREHPDWPGCQLFLANRLAAIRLTPEDAWFPEFMARIESYRRGQLSARLYGELLDYLALAAAYQRWPTIIGRVALVCPNCGGTFVSSDGRRRYCDSCSKPKVRNAVRAQRYRDRKGNQKTQ